MGLIVEADTDSLVGAMGDLPGDFHFLFANATLSDTWLAPIRAAAKRVREMGGVLYLYALPGPVLEALKQSGLTGDASLLVQIIPRDLAPSS